MKVVTLTRGGQVSIPAELRRDWPSNKVLVEETDGGVLLRPLPADPIGAARGILAGRGRPGVSVALALRDARRDDAELDARRSRGVRPRR